jgi:hypothetical protein
VTSRPSGADIVHRATGLLAAFNHHGVLAPADVHVASRLATLLHETDDRVILALALTVRATRRGSVVTDLSSVAQTTPASCGWPGTTRKNSVSPTSCMPELALCPATSTSHSC